MGLRMFNRKNVFFEETHHCNDENNGTKQTQQNYTHTHIAREQLVKQKILRNNEQQKD
jgi:hypothetical protein